MPVTHNTVYRSRTDLIGVRVARGRRLSAQLVRSVANECQLFSRHILETKNQSNAAIDAYTAASNCTLETKPKRKNVRRNSAPAVVAFDASKRNIHGFSSSIHKVARSIRGRRIRAIQAMQNNTNKAVPDTPSVEYFRQRRSSNALEYTFETISLNVDVPDLPSTPIEEYKGIADGRRGSHGELGQVMESFPSSLRRTKSCSSLHGNHKLNRRELFTKSNQQVSHKRSAWKSRQAQSCRFSSTSITLGEENSNIKQTVMIPVAVIENKLIRVEEEDAVVHLSNDQYVRNALQKRRSILRVESF